MATSSVIPCEVYEYDVRIAIRLVGKQCAICTRESGVFKDPNKISIMGLLSGSLPSQGRIQVQRNGTTMHTIYMYQVLRDKVPEPTIREMADACRPYLEVVLLPCRTMI